MIPKFMAVTFCRECEGALSDGGMLCTFKCKWDGTTNVSERPVIVKTYWLQEERVQCERHARTGEPCNGCV